MAKEKEKETTRERGLARWDPFEEFEMFSPWRPFRESGLLPSRLGRLFGESGLARARFAPSIDISEDDNRYVVTAELPGAKRDDITVEMHDQVLTIRGEKKSEREEKKEQSRYVERSYGSFSRSFTLPANANPDQIKANFADGVLTVEVPKREEAKPKVISIK